VSGAGCRAAGWSIQFWPEAETLYSTNLREESHDGLDYATSLARQYRAHLTLLHIVDQDEPRSSTDQWLKPDYQLLRQLVLDEGLSTEPTFRIEVTKNTSARFLRVTDDIAADLIVMDVRPEEPWATHLLDRVYEVISFSNCPVLTVRTRAEVALAQLWGSDPMVRSSLAIRRGANPASQRTCGVRLPFSPARAISTESIRYPAKRKTSTAGMPHGQQGR
jgi:nucleotide-binding universal stress UspA family protein